MHVAFLQDMQGGELTVAASDIDPEEHVQPETNLLVRFRGSATHRLRSLPKEQFAEALTKLSLHPSTYLLYTCLLLLMHALVQYWPICKHCLCAGLKNL